MSFRRTFLASTILIVIIAGLVWILNIEGIIKGAWSNPLSALFTILAVLFAFIQVAFLTSTASNSRLKTSVTPINLSTKPQSPSQPALSSPTPQIKVEEFSLMRTFQGHTGWVYSVAISPDGQTLISKGYDNSVKVWNLYTGQLLHIPERSAHSASNLIISSDGESFATDTSDGIKVWSLSSGELLHTITLPRSRYFARSITISPDGQTLTTTDNDDSIRIWNLSTGELLHTIEGYSSRAYNVIISSDGQTLANGNEDGTINVWNWRTGKLLHILKGNSPIDKDINSLVDGRKISKHQIIFSPDGQSLLSFSKDKAIMVWNQHTGQLIYTLNYNETGIFGTFSITFSCDGRTIAGGSQEGIKAWKLYTGQLLGILREPPSHSISIAISSDGQNLAIGDDDGTIKVWRKN